MKKLGFEEGLDDRLATDKRTLSKEVHDLKEKLDTLEARYYMLLTRLNLLKTCY